VVFTIIIFWLLNSETFLTVLGTCTNEKGFVLHKIGSADMKAVVQELVSWWEAVHYAVLRRRCAEAGMHDLAAKQATCLLRYIGAVPADKAFYEAGTNCVPLRFYLLDVCQACDVHISWAFNPLRYTNAVSADKAFSEARTRSWLALVLPT